MGASLVYLDKPNKDIAHEEGSNDKLTYVASEMQGWRINMVSYLPSSSFAALIYVWRCNRLQSQRRK